jgi:glycosyltransferase involved in cell wall biosynthesis
MNILTSSYTLDLAGVPTFTLAMYKELVKRGHNVIVYSPLGGKLEAEMQVIKELNELPNCDIIIAQHTPCAIALRGIFPETPLIFYSHSIWVEIDQPPPSLIDYYFAINEAVRDNLISQGIPEAKIAIVRDFVDTDRFNPVTPLRPTLEKVVFISNYKKWKNFKTVTAACQKLNLELKCVGAPYGRNYKIEEAINNADLVISWGRGILEGMACGRAVVSFEKLLGDGYLTPEKYFEARKDNFCGFLSKKVFNSVDDLAGEIARYNPADGSKNRELVLKYHEVKNGVDQILKIIEANFDLRHLPWPQFSPNPSRSKAGEPERK